MPQARQKTTGSHEREDSRQVGLILDQPPDQPRPALGRRPWLALLRRARSLRRFAFAIRPESVARPGTRLTLADPAGSWAVPDVLLLTGFLARWQGTRTGAQAVLMRTSHVHGRGLDVALRAVAIDEMGRVVRTTTLRPGRFLRLGGGTWVLELPAGYSEPVSGTALAIYARKGER